MRDTHRLFTSISAAVFILFVQAICHSESYTLQSPDRSIQLIVECVDDIRISIQNEGQAILLPSTLSMTLNDDEIVGHSPVVKSEQRHSVDQIIKPVINEKFDSIRDQCNELVLTFSDDYVVWFRAYNNGIAYRWETHFPDEIIIHNEEASLRFPEQSNVYFTKDTSFRSNYEKPYVQKPIAELTGEDFAGLPFLIETPGRQKLLLAESDLKDYPGLWLQGSGSDALHAVFPQYPHDPSKSGPIESREDYIAKTNGTRTFPWRIIGIANDDKELLLNQLVYQLAEPLRIDDPSWIKPGQVILDWWGRRNVFGVDFEAGVNTATMKFFIDFCADFGVDYFLLDEGWSTREDILDVNPDVNMEEVIAYSKQKDVKLMLWVYWKGLDDRLEQALDQFENWGIDAIKIDFMDRDDQWMVNYYHRVAQAAAQRNISIVFHGAYKPAGLRRPYPNVLSREGFIEFEYNGWTDYANPEHHMTLPFIRMACGPLDYIPGTLNNAQKKNFRPVGDRPMGLGTRAHSFALAVIMESPIRMLPDSPSDYLLEKECTRFLTDIPVEWDETIILEAELGNFISLARRFEDIWYVAAATDWDAREAELDFSFLEPGQYNCEIMQDGPNSHNRARDYQFIEKRITNKDALPIHMAPGGGWLARITKTP